MKLWFDENKQDEILLKYLPKGKIFKQAHIKNTNFNNVIKWMGSGFGWLLEKYNKTFKGLFICESDYLLENFKKDYGIPNGIFYSTDDEEHKKDILVLKYLMRGNTEWNFRAIANIYDYDIKIESGASYLKGKRFPYKFPIKIGIGVSNPHNILVIYFKEDSAKRFPYKFPLSFKEKRKLEKIKKIYDIIKQPQTRIIYKVDKNLTDKRLELC